MLESLSVVYATKDLAFSQELYNKLRDCVAFSPQPMSFYRILSPAQNAVYLVVVTSAADAIPQAVLDTVAPHLKTHLLEVAHLPDAVMDGLLARHMRTLLGMIPGSFIDVTHTEPVPLDTFEPVAV